MTDRAKRKRGRPPIDGETRSERLNLRVSPSYLARLRKAADAAGESVSAYLIRAAMARIEASEAKPGCRSCHGKGISGHRVLEDPTGEVRVPIVCRCVVRGGGIREGALDRAEGGTR